MTTHTIKTAISLPIQDFKLIEAWRKKFKKNRSKIILEAIRAWFKTHDLRDQEEKYAQGYINRPEEKKELEAHFKVGMASWHKEEW